MPEVKEGPILPCPECRMRGRTGRTRIGNRRRDCPMCNNFAQNVMRLTRKKMMWEFAEEYERIRKTVELDLYPQVIQDWSARNGME